MTTKPLLEARGLGFRVGLACLVDAVSLEAHAGEVLTVVGPNGAGKSTLLRLLSGELPATSGDILLDSRPLVTYRPDELALRRAVLPQQTVLQFSFSAREVVLMGRNPHIKSGWPWPSDYGVAEQAMARTESLHLATRSYPTLSGGEQSRITLARVLAQETPLLLLDEPTSSLDVRHQEQVMEVARELAATGACVVVIIHDLNLAAAYSDRILILRRGAVAACGAPDEVLQESLLSEVFEHPLRVLREPSLPHALVVPLREARQKRLSVQ